MKKTKFKIKKKHLPILFGSAGLVAGFVLSTAVFLVLVAYPGDENSFLNASSRGIRIAVDSVFNMGRKEAYGRVASIGDTSLTLIASRAGIVRMYTLSYDATTKFYAFSSDTEVSEIRLRPSDIQMGEQVSVTTTEPIGSKKNQKIVSVLVI